jgi:hypothetical protein
LDLKRVSLRQPTIYDQEKKMKMKAVYASGIVLALSSALFAGEAETIKGAMGEMMKDAAKDAAQKTVVEQMPDAKQIPGMEALVPGMPEIMDDEEVLGGLGEMEMSADEMDEEGDLLITEGKDLKKKAVEMRLKEKAGKEKGAKKAK